MLTLYGYIRNVFLYRMNDRSCGDFMKVISMKFIFILTINALAAGLKIKVRHAIRSAMNRPERL
mgnify:CR=1 FL=1